MNSKERKRYINKVKRFAKSKTGLAKIKQICPQLAEVIINSPELLNIHQYKNDPRTSGNYINSIYDKTFYTGQSGNVFLREAEHIYNFLTDASYYGGIYKKGTKACFKIFAVGVEDINMRLFIEEKVIKKFEPVLQYTSEEADEYGKDKPLLENHSREEVPVDTCVHVHLRIERFKKIEEEFFNNN